MFPGARGARGWAAVQGYVLAPPDPPSDLQAIEPVEPSDSLAIHALCLPAQQDPDAEVSKPRPRVRELPDPQPQCSALSRIGP